MKILLLLVCALLPQAPRLQQAPELAQAPALKCACAFGGTCTCGENCQCDSFARKNSLRETGVAVQPDTTHWKVVSPPTYQQPAYAPAPQQPQFNYQPQYHPQMQSFGSPPMGGFGGGGMRMGGGNCGPGG